MKSATLFLVAVTAFTLFLESSTAPSPSSEISNRVAALINSITVSIVGSYGDTVVIDEEFIQFVYSAIEATENALADAQRVVEDGLSTASGEEKESLEHVKAWLDEYLEGTVANLSETLLNAIYSGSVPALKEMKSNINEAIVYTRETLDGFNNILSEGDAKDGLNVSVNTILDLSGKVVEGLEERLAGRNAIV